MKNVSPGPSISAAEGAPWMPHGTTYPSSYILTENPPILPSSNVHKTNFECPPSHSWRLPDPYDCSIYHDCIHGTGTAVNCPAQLYYNPERQTCDHAQNVQCNRLLFLI